MFSKRHKWRNFAVTGTKRNSVSPDKSDKASPEIVDDVFTPGIQQKLLGHPRINTSTVTAEVHVVDSSASDSQITSFSEMVARADKSSEHVLTSGCESSATSCTLEDEIGALLKGDTTEMVWKMFY